jgi:hypothetical protein
MKAVPVALRLPGYRGSCACVSFDYLLFTPVGIRPVGHGLGFCHSVKKRGLRLVSSVDNLSLEDESYAMANLSPRMTGISRHVFVSPRMGSHDVRIKVSVAPGKNTLPVNCAVIALRPAVHHVAGPALAAGIMAEVERWVSLNIQPLIDYWDGNIDTGELFSALKSI